VIGQSLSYVLHRVCPIDCSNGRLVVDRLGLCALGACCLMFRLCSPMMEAATNASPKGNSPV
jgi:hypothetical protein